MERENMKAICINCFDHYEERTSHIERALESRGYSTTHIISDFNHNMKKKYETDRNNVIHIPTFSYRKNLSVRRMISHIIFARSTYKVVKKETPDLVYVLFPPNFVARYMAKYKRKNRKTRLILDIFDLWPESFPTKKNIISSIFFKGWAHIRNSSLPYADILLIECGLYNTILEMQKLQVESHLLYLGKDFITSDIPNKIDIETINIAYLGSLNNVIDINLMCKLLEEINLYRPVILHIIGAGENSSLFIEKADKVVAEVKFYGKIYDFDIKKRIFDKCYFGLNIMKSSVVVGLSIKTIDYFQAGLPIINNVGADTKQIIEDYGVGLNVTEENIDDIAKKIPHLDLNEIIKMKQKTINYFERNFSSNVIHDRINEILDEKVFP